MKIHKTLYNKLTAAQKKIFDSYDKMVLPGINFVNTPAKVAPGFNTGNIGDGYLYLSKFKTNTDFLNYLLSIQYKRGNRYGLQDGKDDGKKELAQDLRNLLGVTEAIQSETKWIVEELDEKASIYHGH